MTTKPWVASALVLVLAGGGWLLSRHVLRDPAPGAVRTLQSVSNTKADSGSATVPVAAVGVSPTASKAAQVLEVRKALEQLQAIYGPAGSLEWDAARALIAQRKKATEELVDRLAALGAGGAQAMAAGYAEAESTRAKLLLVHALAKISDEQAASVLQALLGGESSFSLRKEIVAALGQRREAAADQALAAVLVNSDEAQLRFTAAQGLSGRGSALPLLTERLRTESNLDVRKELIRSVGRVGNPAAMAALTQVAQTSPELAVRESAIQELNRSFGTSALPR